MNPPHRGHQATWGGFYSRNGQTCSSLTGRTSGLPHQLGTIQSSVRYKEDIQDIGSGSDALMNLRPVQFRYKRSNVKGEKPLQYGLIAEEVAKVFPQLVVHNQQGEIET